MNESFTNIVKHNEILIRYFLSFFSHSRTLGSSRPSLSNNSFHLVMCLFTRSFTTLPVSRKALFSAELVVVEQPEMSLRGGTLGSVFSFSSEEIAMEKLIDNKSRFFFLFFFSMAICPVLVLVRSSSSCEIFVTKFFLSVEMFRLTRLTLIVSKW